MKIKNNFLLSVALLSAFSSAQVSCSEDNRWSDEFKQAMINLTNSVLQVGLSVYTMKKTMKEASFTVYKAGTIKDNFESVAGNHEAKESFKDIIEYLKNPAKYHAIGAKVTSGILMTGNPGTGKTLLARSLAGEANCAFISASGSEFITKYQGSGTERVKRLFAQAREQYTWTTQNLKLVRKHIPCIIFIDEVDAIAGKRGGRGSSENDTTLNQLLTEMDGFVKGSQPIIVIAATNHPEALDSAVTRPGRFDRTLHIPLPDLKDRQAILNVHLKKVVHAADIDLLSIGQRTIGYSGADLAEIINAAARLAVNKKRVAVTIEDIEEALDVKSLGVVSKTALPEKEKLVAAYHEAGHALVSHLTQPYQQTVKKMTITPRGGSPGATHFLPIEESRSKTKEDFLNEIAVLLGGRAAEELIFNVVTTGPSNDLQRATAIARHMICSAGMSESLGMRLYDNNQVANGNTYAVETETKIDEEVRKTLDTQYARVKKLLQTHISNLRRLGQELITKETLDEAQIKELCPAVSLENVLKNHNVQIRHDMAVLDTLKEKYA